MIATLFHGSVNSFGIVNNALNPVQKWGLDVIIGEVSGGHGVATGKNFTQTVNDVLGAPLPRVDARVRPTSGDAFWQEHVDFRIKIP